MHPFTFPKYEIRGSLWCWVKNLMFSGTIRRAVWYVQPTFRRNMLTPTSGYNAEVQWKMFQVKKRVMSWTKSQGLPATRIFSCRCLCSCLVSSVQDKIATRRKITNRFKKRNILQYTVKTTGSVSDTQTRFRNMQTASVFLFWWWWSEVCEKLISQCNEKLY